MDKKVVICHSGGQDSTCMMLEAIDNVGVKNVYSLGFNYGQRHFCRENEAAIRFCERFNIPRKILTVPLGELTKGSSLTDTSVEMTEDLNMQRTTNVQLRNMMFMTFAAAYAIENGCSEIYHGSCREDEKFFRDCRPIFFKYLEHTIQAGRTLPINGSENMLNDIKSNGFVCPDKIDLKIVTPLIDEKKEETLARILKKHDVEIFKDSWTCYNGGLGKYNKLSCGKCCSCQERLAAFDALGIKDPLEYYTDNVQ